MRLKLQKLEAIFSSLWLLPYLLIRTCHWKPCGSRTIPYCIKKWVSSRLNYFHSSLNCFNLFRQIPLQYSQVLHSSAPRKVPRQRFQVIHVSRSCAYSILIDIYFRNQGELPDNRVCVAVEIKGKRFLGAGSNSEAAKRAAAKYALRDFATCK